MLVDLPIVAAETSLDDALKRLKQAERGAVVVPEGAKYRLIDAADVVHGFNARIGTIDKLVSHRSASLLFSGVPRGKGFSHKVREMVGGVRIEFVRVEVTDEDLVARIVNEVRLYYCNGPRRHPFLPDEVAIGQECPEGDGGIIQG